MGYKIAKHERILRHDDNYGIYILYQNRVYQRSESTYEYTLFGSKFHHEVIPTSFNKVGKSIVFHECNLNTLHYLEVFGYADDLPHAWWGNVKERWYWVKSKPEGHYHYAC